MKVKRAEHVFTAAMDGLAPTIHAGGIRRSQATSIQHWYSSRLTLGLMKALYKS